MNNLSRACGPIFVFLFFGFAINEAQASCADLKIEGADCAHLKATWDISKCSSDTIVQSKTVRCSEEAAYVKVIGQKNTYRAHLKKKAGAWESAWVLRDGIDVRANALAKSKAPEKVTAKTVEPAAEAPKPVIAATAATVSAPVVAQVVAPPAPPEVKANNGFSFSAYFDVYYSYNFNKPVPTGAPTATTTLPSANNNLHYYDWYSNQFALNLAEITIKHTRKETAFLLDLDFGQMADINAATVATAVSGGPTSSSVDQISKHIGQAVFTYTPEAAPGLVLEAGKMPTHIGFEVMKPKDNWNYTRSTIFSFGGPFWHTGFHGGYAVVPDQFFVNAYMYQGWNSVQDVNVSPSWGAQLKWTPSGQTTVVYNYIGGPEQSQNNSNWKQLHDFIISHTISPLISVAGEVLYGREAQPTTTLSQAQWFGFEALAKFQFSKCYSLSPRFEMYRDQNGWTLGGNDQMLTTYTLTQAFQVSEGFEVRLEGRLDHSNNGNRFIRHTNAADTVAGDQVSALFGILYTM